MPTVVSQTERALIGHGARRIVVFGNQWESAYRFRGPLIGDLVRLGVSVHVIGPNGSDAYRERIEAIGAATHGAVLSRSGLNPIHECAAIVSIVRILRGIRPDLVFSYFAKPVIYGSIAGALAGVPERYSLIAGLGYVFSDTDGESTRRRVLLGWLVRRLYRFALTRNRLVFFQNPDDRRHFIDAGLVTDEKAIRVNGTGVDLKAYPFCEAVEEPVTFVLAARLLAEKGIREYALAAKRLRARGWQFRCILLGPLDDNPDAIGEAEIAGWVAEGLLEWPGAVDDVRPWLERSSVYVLPTYYREGVPRSIQEAMAVGRPIITTDTPGCRDTVCPGRNGFLVPPRDPAALADAMACFLEDRSRIRIQGTESRRLAEERYDVYRINRAMLSRMGLLPDDSEG